MATSGRVSSIGGSKVTSSKKTSKGTTYKTKSGKSYTISGTGSSRRISRDKSSSSSSSSKKSSVSSSPSSKKVSTTTTITKKLQVGDTYKTSSGKIMRITKVYKDVSGKTKFNAKDTYRRSISGASKQDTEKIYTRTIDPFGVVRDKSGKVVQAAPISKSSIKQRVASIRRTTGETPSRAQQTKIELKKAPPISETISATARRKGVIQLRDDSSPISAKQMKDFVERQDPVKYIVDAFTGSSVEKRKVEATLNRIQNQTVNKLKDIEARKLILNTNLIEYNKTKNNYEKLVDSYNKDSEKLKETFNDIDSKRNQLSKEEFKRRVNNYNKNVNDMSNKEKIINTVGKNINEKVKTVQTSAFSVEKEIDKVNRYTKEWSKIEEKINPPEPTNFNEMVDKSVIEGKKQAKLYSVIGAGIGTFAGGVGAPVGAVGGAVFGFSGAFVKTGLKKLHKEGINLVLPSSEGEAEWRKKVRNLEPEIASTLGETAFYIAGTGVINKGFTKLAEKQFLQERTLNYTYSGLSKSAAAKAAKVDLKNLYNVTPLKSEFRNLKIVDDKIQGTLVQKGIAQKGFMTPSGVQYKSSSFKVKSPFEITTKELSKEIKTSVVKRGDTLYLKTKGGKYIKEFAKSLDKGKRIDIKTLESALRDKKAVVKIFNQLDYKPNSLKDILGIKDIKITAKPNIKVTTESLTLKPVIKGQKIMLKKKGIAKLIPDRFLKPNTETAKYYQKTYIKPREVLSYVEGGGKERLTVESVGITESRKATVHKGLLFPAKKVNVTKNITLTDIAIKPIKTKAGYKFKIVSGTIGRPAGSGKITLSPFIAKGTFKTGNVFKSSKGKVLKIDTKKGLDKLMKQIDFKKTNPLSRYISDTYSKVAGKPATKGFYDPITKTIYVNQKLAPKQLNKLLIHEATDKVKKLPLTKKEVSDLITDWDILKVKKGGPNPFKSKELIFKNYSGKRVSREMLTNFSETYPNQIIKPTTKTGKKLSKLFKDYYNIEDQKLIANTKLVKKSTDKFIKDVIKSPMLDLTPTKEISKLISKSSPLKISLGQALTVKGIEPIVKFSNSKLSITSIKSKSGQILLQVPKMNIKTSQKNEVLQIIIPKLDFTQIQKQEQLQSLKQVQEQLVSQTTSQIQKQLTEQLQIQDQKSLQKQLTKIVQTQLQTQIQSQLNKLRTKQVTKLNNQFSIFNTPAPRVPVPRVPFKLPEFEDNKKKITPGKKQAFNVRVKSKGVFTKVNTKPLTFRSAHGLGIFVTDNTPAASYKIKKTKGKPIKTRAITQLKKLNQYRPSKIDKNVFVEKRKNRIDTFGEKQGITVKGLLALSLKPKRRVKRKKRR